MKRMLLGLGLVASSLLVARESEAQAYLPGESVAYETVSPGSRTVTYGERYVVRRKPFKTVIRERPTRYVTTTPPVVRETRVIQPAPVLERRVIQPAPVIETRVIRSSPVIQTRYLAPYPF